ncbi:MAG TPA: alpha/beta hydrolase [Ktedonobacteraceae bacterium]|nr:alpha/beta hydrolase [Ktedonobacteraceae bacterium]
MYTTSYIFEYRGCPLHYWLTGPQGAPLVVFTHGADMNHESWDGIVPLAAQRYRILTWDVRLHGLSRPGGEPFSIKQATEDLLALLDHLECERASFVGHSMGGNIGQEVAIFHPERVDALIMLDCACNTLKLSLSESLSVRAATALSSLFRLYPDELLKQQSARANAFTPAVQEYLYSVFCQIPKDDFLTIFLETFKCLHYEPGYRIPRPLLLLVGEHDTMGNIRKVAPQWVRRDSCQYSAIPAAGHCSQLDNPAAVQPLVLDFLAAFYL